MQNPLLSTSVHINFHFVTCYETYHKSSVDELLFYMPHMMSNHAVLGVSLDADHMLYMSEALVMPRLYIQDF